MTATSTRVVGTTLGSVVGRVEANGIMTFLGIPYAAPTGGVNRFLPPTERAPWAGVFDASEVAPICPQQRPWIYGGERTHSEDCLRVNVWTQSAEGSRPVMIWWHGGAFRHGSGELISGQPIDPSELARRDVVVLTVNHRIGVLGFLQLGEEFGPRYASSGNVGMLDLAASLRWVRDNIAAFGGDPDNVTVMGSSGGGAKIVHAMAMPAFDGLFHRAIVMSGHDLAKRNPRVAALDASRSVLRQAGISDGDIESLCALPAHTLVDALASATARYEPDPRWGPERWIKYDILSPHVDGNSLPDYPLDAIGRGSSADVDLIVALDQWSHWTLDRRPPRQGVDPALYGHMSVGDLATSLRPLLQDETDDVIGRYRKALPGASPSTLLALIVTDRDWWIPALRLAEAKARGGGAKARVLFNSLASGGSPGVQDLVFGSGGFAGPFARAVVGQAQGALLRFAATGDPNGPDVPTWEPYSPERRSVLRLDYHVEAVVDLFRDQRLIWEGAL